LVGAAKRLNAGPVSAMLIGSGVAGSAAAVTGVDKTYVVDNAALAEYTTDGFTQAAAAAAAQADPAIILLGRRTSAATSHRRSPTSSPLPSRWTRLRSR